MLKYRKNQSTVLPNYLIAEQILLPLTNLLSLYLPVNIANTMPTITSIPSCRYYLSLNLLFNHLLLLPVPIKPGMDLFIRPLRLALNQGLSL
jgi:hypothetical protein